MQGQDAPADNPQLGQVDILNPGILMNGRSEFVHSPAEMDQKFYFGFFGARKADIHLQIPENFPGCFPGQIPGPQVCFMELSVNLFPDPLNETLFIAGIKQQVRQIFLVGFIKLRQFQTQLKPVFRILQEQFSF